MRKAGAAAGRPAGSATTDAVKKRQAADKAYKDALDKIRTKSRPIHGAPSGPGNQGHPGQRQQETPAKKEPITAHPVTADSAAATAAEMLFDRP
jgi:hypothetical protein